MGQYNTGSVTLVNGSPVVTGQSTAFLTNVSIGDLFKRLNQNTLYEVASVDSDTQIQLSANYAGSGESAASYTITRNFTPNFNIPEISSGDRDWPYVLTRGLRIIDAGLQVASTGGKLLTDENGVVLTDENDIPLITEIPYNKQPDVYTAGTGAITLTMEILESLIIVAAPNAPRAYTLDTGANFEADGAFDDNDAFDWTIINIDTASASNIITVTASEGHTIVGNPLVASSYSTTVHNSSATFRTRKTATNTFVTYRIS